MQYTDTVPASEKVGRPTGDQPRCVDRDRSKVGIVLTGGGARGAVQVGALAALWEHGIRPFVVAGVSVGAINAAAILDTWAQENDAYNSARRVEAVWRNRICCPEDIAHVPVTIQEVGAVLLGAVRAWNDPDEQYNRLPRMRSVLHRLYTDIAWREALHPLRTAQHVRRLINRLFFHVGTSSGILDQIPIERLIGTVNFRAIGEFSACELVVVATNEQTGDAAYFSSRQHSASVMHAAVLASMGFPPFCCSQVIDGVEYGDGDTVNAIPVRPLLERGCQKIYVLTTHPASSYVIDPDQHATTPVVGSIPAVVRALKHSDFRARANFLRQRRHWMNDPRVTFLEPRFFPPTVQRTFWFRSGSRDKKGRFGPSPDIAAMIDHGRACARATLQSEEVPSLQEHDMIR